MIWIIKWTLLIVFLEPIVCSWLDIFTMRNKKVSPSENKSEMDNWTETATRSYKHSEKLSDSSAINVNDKIQKIFILGTENDTVLFENNIKSSSHSKKTQTNNNRSFNISQELFKVKRDPTGMLNLVFNDLIFSQKHASTMPADSSAESQPQQDRPWTPKGKASSGGTSIIFPDDNYSKPKCLEKGKSFCTTVKNYPVQELEKTLKHEYANYDVFFGNDLPQPLNISQRMSPGKDSMCVSTEQIVYPQAGETMDNSWLYIVNHGNYTQGVRIEECVAKESPCMFSQSFPNGYVATCEQNYIYRSLVAYGKNGTIVNDHFRLPSCCKCIIKQV